VTIGPAALADGRRRPKITIVGPAPIQSPGVTGDSAAPAAQPASRPLSPPVLWTVAIVFGLLIGSARSLTLPATLLVAFGGLAIWLAARYAPPDPILLDGPVPMLGVVAWTAVFSTFVVWELVAFLVGNNDAHPTFSMLTDPVLAFRPTRALCGVLWLGCGWFLLGRRGLGD
jgi:hypothetical protein